MRALIISDSHGDTKRFEKAISATMPDVIIHLGDIERDVEYLEAVHPEIPLYAVLGNNDPWVRREAEKVIELEGVKIFMTHGHLYGVWDEGARIAKRAEETGCTVALFGHSHVSVDKIYDNVHVFNPGSISRPRMGEYSVGVMEIEKGEVKFALCDWL
ncbi:MAG: metallophosphoesterase [Clostridia bacterium]|nr:metallophosphoesterase [Clostridia bacterium]